MTQMRLFLLEPHEDMNVATVRYGWHGFAGIYAASVLAEDEAQARALVDAQEIFWKGMYLDPEATSCTELPLDKAAVILAAQGTG